MKREGSEDGAPKSEALTKVCCAVVYTAQDGGDGAPSGTRPSSHQTLFNISQSCSLSSASLRRHRSAWNSRRDHVEPRCKRSSTLQLLGSDGCHLLKVKGLHSVPCQRRGSGEPVKEEPSIGCRRKTESLSAAVREELKVGARQRCDSRRMDSSLDRLRPSRRPFSCSSSSSGFLLSSPGFYSRVLPAHSTIQGIFLSLLCFFFFNSFRYWWTLFAACSSLIMISGPETQTRLRSHDY